jgi:hypothetical protein
LNFNHLINDILGTYQKHGWQLRRVLLSPEGRAQLTDNALFEGDIHLQDAKVDALWFSRPSHAEREAWELRLLAENPYALFETFEKNETEEQREERRRELEARLEEYVRKK